MKLSILRKLGVIAFLISLATLANSQVISILSPANGTTVSSPAKVSAFATAGTAFVTAVRLYVDDQPVITLNASRMDTTANLNPGQHKLVVVAWDTLGRSFAQTSFVSVGGNVTASPNAYANDLHNTSSWLATQFAPSGALLYSSERINPYYANLAAMGLLKDSTRYVQVENWMRWYLGHLNRTDKWNLGGTMYDYNIVNGKEVSSGDADSTDSYAATFLSLAYAYYATGNPAAQSYVRSIAGDLDLIAQALAKTQQPDGLTWAKPDYKIKYLMDNAEVFRGLADAATLFGSLGDKSKQVYYGVLATRCQVGVWSMWLGNKWAIYKDGIGRLAAPNMATWYPDASAQLFPVLYGVVSGSDSRAKAAYDYFNQAWPGWANLSFSKQDPFPWVMIADAAALMGDRGRVDTYANSVRDRWVNKGFPWTWYSMEAGWYMRLAAYMQGQGM